MAGNVTVTRDSPYRITIQPEGHGGSGPKTRDKEPKVAKDKPANYSEEIATIQREMLRDGFPVTVDGIDGPETKRIIESYRQAKAEKARQDAARSQAEATAKAAEAAAIAEREKAEAEKTRATAGLEKLKADAAEAERKEREDREKRVDEAHQRNVKTGLQTAAVVTGIGGGTLLAKGITKKDELHTAKTNKELEALGRQVEKSTKVLENPRSGKAAKVGATARINGAVVAADQLRPKGAIQKAARLSSRLGFVKAALLAGEGIYSREVLAKEQQAQGNATVAEAISQTGTASLFAAVTLVGDRGTSIATGTPAKSAAVAKIEAARTFTADTKVAINAAKANAVAAKAGGAEVVALRKAATKIASKGIGIVALIAGVASIVQTARAEGVIAASREALDAVDPTGGLITKAVFAAAGDNEPSMLQELAKQQAAERNAQAAGTPSAANVAAEIASPNQAPSADLALTAPSGVIIDQAMRGNLDMRQAALMSVVAQESGNYYAGATPAEQMRRESALGASNRGAHEVAADVSSRSGSSAPSAPARDVVPPADSGNHLKGFQNPQNLLAAQLARAAKGN